MEVQNKIKLLSKLAAFECEGKPDLKRHIYNASTPEGRKPILKVMQSTYCEKNCDYCIFRRDRDETPRLFIPPRSSQRALWSSFLRGR